jgi:opacity protein-like surface antigen
MKRVLGMVAGATLAVAAAAAPAVAQDAAASPMQFGVQGGIIFPDGGDIGLQVAGTLGMRPAALPIGLRFDVGYSRYGVEGVDVTGSVIHGMGSAVFTIPTESTFRPYVLGGLGIYRSSFDVDIAGVDDSSTDLGFHAGGGIELPLGGLNSYVEARLHFGDVEFIPIMFGIRF